MADNGNGRNPNKVSEYVRLGVTVVLTSGILIGFGRLTGSQERDSQRLSSIDQRLSILSERVQSSVNEGMSINVHQSEQLIAAIRRIDNLEESAQANHNLLVRVEAQLQVQSNQMRALVEGLNNRR